MRLMLAFVVALLCAVPPVMAQRGGSSSQIERYRVLSERNIFLKDRTQPTSQPAPTTQSTRSDPEQSLILRGIVEEDGGYRAYIEDSSAGTILRLGVGDAVGRGKIAEIGIDAVVYDARDQRLSITIGSDLTGRTSDPYESISLAEESTPSTMPAGMENINPNDPNLTVEQRLKLRRMQELKGK